MKSEITLLTRSNTPSNEPYFRHVNPVQIPIFFFSKITIYIIVTPVHLPNVGDLPSGFTTNRMNAYPDSAYVPPILYLITVRTI